MAAATTIGIEEVRVFLSNLVWGLGEVSSRPVLGAIAAAPFALVLLAGPFLRGVGPRRGLWLTAAWLSAAYLAEHTSNRAELDLGLAGFCVLAWGWFLVAALVTIRRGVGLGLLMGASLDVALRLGLLTLDVPWIDHPLATAVALLLGGYVIVGTHRVAAVVQETGEADWRSISGLLAIGPWLAVTLLVTGNPPQVAARLGSSYGVVVGALALGHAAGISLASGTLARPIMSPGLTFLGTLMALAFIPLWNGWALGPVWAAAACVSAALMLAGALTGAERPSVRGSAAGTALLISLSLLLFLGLAYAAYALYDGFPWAFVALALLVGFAVVGGASTLKAGAGGAMDVLRPARAGAGAVLVLGLLRAITWYEPTADEIAPIELTVMTYNVRLGFGRDDRWDLERTARTIERERPDVVVLGEVARGWLVGSGADEAFWLAQRLGMAAVFGAAAGDLHGNLLLSRYRVEGAGHRFAERSSGALPRGAVEGVVATERGPLVVLGTHLDPRADAQAVRAGQVAELMRAVEARAPVLLMGDFNAEASSPELRPILDAGFIDGPASLGVTERTWPSSAPARRIDHVFVGPGLRVVSAQVRESDASDHLPVVVRVRLV